MSCLSLRKIVYKLSSTYGLSASDIEAYKLIMAENMVVSLVAVIFTTNHICRFGFVIVHCLNMQNIGPHGTTVAETLISSSEGSHKDK